MRKKSEEQATGRAWRPEKGEEQDKGRQSEGGRTGGMMRQRSNAGWGGGGERENRFM